MVVDALPHAWGADFAREAPATKRYRGTVVDAGAEIDLPDGCPRPARVKRVWRVDYDDDKKVWATPERFLSVVATPATTPFRLQTRSEVGGRASSARSLPQSRRRTQARALRATARRRARGDAARRMTMPRPKPRGPAGCRVSVADRLRGTSVVRRRCRARDAERFLTAAAAVRRVARRWCANRVPLTTRLSEVIICRLSAAY